MSTKTLLIEKEIEAVAGGMFGVRIPTQPHNPWPYTTPLPVNPELPEDVCFGDLTNCG